MAYISTGSYSILRGVATETYSGDPTTGDPRIIAEGLHASVTEQSRRVFDPSEGSTALVRYFNGRFRPGTDVKTGDLVRDDRTRETYVVEDVVHATSPVHRPDVRVSLSRTE